MANYNTEVTYLIDNGLLPNQEYLAMSRFTTHYQNSEEFVNKLLEVGFYPIATGIVTISYAVRAVWAALRAVGNLLILKPNHTLDAVNDICFHTTLTICLALMAPIHAITYTMELLTRTISSWFTGQEPSADLSEFTLASKFRKETDGPKSKLLPSSTYFSSSRFFSPYKDAIDLLSQAFTPAISFTKTSFYSLSQALNALTSALRLMINLAICKPRHALEDLHAFNVHTSLTIALAIMAPINATVESIAFITRLGTTWVDVCMDNKEEEEEEEEEFYSKYPYAYN